MRSALLRGQVKMRCLENLGQSRVRDRIGQPAEKSTKLSHGVTIANSVFQNGASLTPAEILARIIGPDHTLADVKAAFSGQHPEIPAYDWVADVKLRGERVAIEGIIRKNRTEIGHFTRQLYYAKGIGTAFHTIMEIEKDEDKDRDIGRHHYRRAIAFYESAGIRQIDMDAEGEGPVVWATFGFDFARSQHREMLMKILREWEIAPLPDQVGLLAPNVVAISTEENQELGADAIYELLDRAREPLPMSLDLRNEAQRVYLRERRILDARPS